MTYKELLQTNKKKNNLVVKWARYMVKYFRKK